MCKNNREEWTLSLVGNKSKKTPLKSTEWVTILEEKMSEKCVCVCVWLVVIYGKAILLGYLMSNPVYTHIRYMWLVNSFLGNNNFKRAWTHLFAHI